jgi:N-acetylglucosaminyldiphosphoundecaprenol N-acetyl-beta-D-mannosaminyltransferase
VRSDPRISDTSARLRLCQRWLWGVPLHSISSPDSLEEIISHAKARKPFAVAYLAVNNLVSGALSAQFRESLSRFDLLLADGKPVHWTVKYLLKGRESNHTTAREQMLAVCDAAARDGLSILLYGTTNATLARLSLELHKRFPGLRIAMQRASVFRPLTEEEADHLVDEFNSCGADIAFVALGCPLQEHLVASLRGRINLVCLCVGSAFEIHAGMKRAPPWWIKALAMEWSFRLLQDPARLWKRYLFTNTLFAGLLLRTALGNALERIGALLFFRARR